ncbi:N-acetylglucosamine-6-phosphate deacetylase [Paraglaciecola sp. 2405UD69-4]|uniref:N-acetylglucosamine-6-phosphate deacetylase n=1 Tax=Paraglaciecola sp. 2405UD69-4 TaxID=3391836 RepID=UPI0039C9F1C0
MTWFSAKQVFDGSQFHSDYHFKVENGLVTAVSTSATSCDVYLDGLVTPGFVDTQVNGGGGVLFNQAPSLSSLEKIFIAHRQFGTTTMLPTLITDNLNVMRQASDAIAQAIAENMQGIAGVHFEGPHLSVAKRGIHPSNQVRPMSDAEFKLITRKDLGKVLLTIAPENIAPDVIKDLVNHGVIVALGHSNADFDTVAAAIDGGARGATHLFNAMSGLQARAPGLIGAVLADERITAGLIVDLLHVHRTNCQVAFNAKSAKGIMLVTDAMAHVGSDLNELPWLDTVITRDGDKLSTPDGTLAGSCLDMMGAVRRFHQNVGVELKDALYCASATPAEFIGLSDVGHLKEGAKADFLVIDKSLHVQQVYQAGELK